MAFLKPVAHRQQASLLFDDDFSTLSSVSRGNREKGGRNHEIRWEAIRWEAIRWDVGLGGRRSKEEGRGGQKKEMGAIGTGALYYLLHVV